MTTVKLEFYYLLFVSRTTSLLESGIYQFWISETLNVNNEALHLGLIEVFGDYSPQSLRLEHVFGEHIFLFCGLVLSSFALILEFCVFNKTFDGFLWYMRSHLKLLLKRRSINTSRVVFKKSGFHLEKDQIDFYMKLSNANNPDFKSSRQFRNRTILITTIYDKPKYDIHFYY